MLFHVNISGLDSQCIPQNSPCEVDGPWVENETTVWKLYSIKTVWKLTRLKAIYLIRTNHNFQLRSANPDVSFMSIGFERCLRLRWEFFGSTLYFISNDPVRLPASRMHMERLAHPAKYSSMSNSSCGLLCKFQAVYIWHILKEQLYKLTWCLRPIYDNSNCCFMKMVLYRHGSI